jgi:hypothetical protein
MLCMILIYFSLVPFVVFYRLARFARQGNGSVLLGVSSLSGKHPALYVLERVASIRSGSELSEYIIDMNYLMNYIDCSFMKATKPTASLA